MQERIITGVRVVVPMQQVVTEVVVALLMIEAVAVVLLIAAGVLMHLEEALDLKAWRSI
ncbi:hypothetical protein DPMN_050394 [Dreissena polymorpha]|uniref:Uncharacterized protein n=1 Tax=Dreissena polymorpha TaxID=45954 RepID=A0A9D4CH36_DREPO|nr:hypothetical protein DPMN_050394 [Dreissena polymorpha]